MKEIQEIGFIEKGTGKHQSNVVYSTGGLTSDLNCEHRNKIFVNDTRYIACPNYSYCIDANYWKGTTFEQYLKKRRRQLIIEVVK